jgi:hypothetical protein
MFHSASNGKPPRLRRFAFAGLGSRRANQKEQCRQFAGDVDPLTSSLPCRYRRLQFAMR